MLVVFRADASVQIGTGHVMRCLTLADELTRQGHQCRFICREHEGHLGDLIASKGYEIHLLSCAPSTEQQPAVSTDNAHADWLGATWQQDAEQTLEILSPTKTDWLVVDHYALDRRWEELLRPYVNKIMVIDDLADRCHDCDLLLDQNYGIVTDRYECILPAGCTVLYGPSFALLNPVYANIRPMLSNRTGAINRVLIYFGGGAESARFANIALQAFCEPELHYIQLDIVISSGSEEVSEIKAVAARRGGVTIYSQLPDLAGLMSIADLAIGAGGSTTWERCCLGLPTVLVVCALNQEDIGEAMGLEGAALVLRPGDQLAYEIKKAVVMFCHNKNAYVTMSKKASAICDGLGVVRVSERL